MHIVKHVCLSLCLSLTLLLSATYLPWVEWGLIDEWMNEWMNEWINERITWLLIYRLATGQWVALNQSEGMFSSVEQSKNTFSWLTSCFPTINYSSTISYLYFLSFSFIFLLSVAHQCSSSFYCAECLYVSETLLTQGVHRVPKKVARCI